MRQIRKFIIWAFLIYAGLFIFKYKTVSTTSYYTTTTELNVRVGSGSNNPIAFTLEKGTEVEILEKGNRWYKIKHSDWVGYVNSRYLKYTRTAFDKEVFTA